MDKSVFPNYRHEPEIEEEPDNTDSGSYPSVFDIQFSKNIRRLGRRNRSAATLKPLENQENPTPLSQLSSITSESQTHPINPGAGPSFLNSLGKNSTTFKSNIHHAQSVEKIGFNNVNYRHVDQCKKNLNYDPSIKTPDKFGSLVNPDILASRKKYPFLVSSSQDKENIIPENDRFKEPVQPKSVFNTRVSDQVDAPIKSHSAISTFGSSVFYPNHYTHTHADKFPKPINNLPPEPTQQKVCTDSSIPCKALDLSPHEKTENISDSSQDSTCYETAMMNTSKLIIDSPLDLSSHTAHKNMSKSHTSMEVTGTIVDLMSLVNLNSAELPTMKIAPSEHETPLGPKPVDTPFLCQPNSLPNMNSQPSQQTMSEACSRTPVRPTSDFVSKNQNKNESTPVFKRPLSVDSYNQSNASNSSQEQNQKPTTEPVKSNVTVPPTSIVKQSAESSNDVITLNGKQYQVLGLLGKGGSSSVYVVQDTAVTEFKPLALKVVNLSSIPDQSTADGYVKEVHYLEKLRGCPCVITMQDYEYDTTSKHLYVLMEKGDSDLSKYLKNISKMITIPNTMIIIIKHWYEMLLAVKAIHAEGIIHSDLKPANFLFVGGVLKIIDFGIASSLQGDQTSVYKDTASGTLNYMSPESIGHSSCTSRITFKSDVWSLGCILYNMIYGKTPYSHIPNAWAKMQAIASPKTQVEFKPHIDDKVIPPTLLQSMKLCLQKDPKARPTVVDLLSIVESRLSSF